MAYDCKKDKESMIDLVHVVKPCSLTFLDVKDGAAFITLEQKALADKEWKKANLPFEEEVVFLYKKKEAFLLPYRYTLACIHHPKKFKDFMPVGVSGVVVAEKSVLIGKRSEKVTLERGMWEYPPSGSLAKSSVIEGKADLGLGLLNELLEETGFTGSSIEKLDKWWVVETALGIEYVGKIFLKHAIEPKIDINEYVEMEWMPLHKWKEEKVKRLFTPLSCLLAKNILECL